MSELPSRDAFAACVGGEFRLAAGEGGALTLVLSELRDGPGGPRLEQFSLLFRGPRDPVLPQGIRHLEHATLGALDIFLVPVGRDARGVEYEAAFSRFREPRG